MKIIICAPIQNYGHSNGILALIHLGVTLSEFGVDVLFCVMAEGNQSQLVINVPRLIEKVNLDNNKLSYEFSILSRLEEVVEKFGIKILMNYDFKTINEYIVVYPEVINGNPLAANRIVRYFGNKNGVLVDPVNLNNNDFVISHSISLCDDANHYLYFPYINPLFLPETVVPFAERRFSSYYVGKGNLYVEPYQYDDLIEITRLWPSKKSALAILLKNSQFLFTYDSWTNTNVEAVLCGAIPVYLHNGPFTDEEIDGSELGKIPRIKFNEDINFSDSFLKKFIAERNDLLLRIVELNNKWKPSVGDLIAKLKNHFS